LNRREAIAALATTAALPLLHGCRNTPAESSSGSAAGAGGEANALAALEQVGEHLLQLFPESATSLGLDTGAHAALRSHLGDRSAAGQQRIADQVRQDLHRAKAIDTNRLSHGTRTSVEVVRSAYATALEGFALPYGDITVGNWRNTPYVVIQNVGAYLDIPRFIDSDHRIENAADAEAYLARLQSYTKQLEGELGRIKAAREKGLVPPAFLIDKALAQMRMSAKGAREGGALVESIARRTMDISGHWSERAKSIAAQDIAPAIDRQIAELEQERTVAKDDAGMWARPNGDEFYRWALKASTTTTMTPDEVHAMGQSELDRLQSQMDAIMKSIGLSKGSVGDRMRAIAEDPKYRFAEGDQGRAEILAFIQDRLAWIRAQLPRAFNTLVNPNMEVKRLPPEEEPGAPTAYGSICGRRSCTANSRSRTWRSTNRFPATSGRANTRTRCRSSASSSPSTPTQKAGHCTRNSWPMNSGHTNTIRSASWVTCRRSPSAPAVWWSTPAFTRSDGRESRGSTSSSNATDRIRSRWPVKSIATARGPDRRVATKSGTARSTGNASARGLRSGRTTI
jgi:uncharacterized protein (DUF885 family)